MCFQNTMLSIHEATGKAARLQANAKKKTKEKQYKTPQTRLGMAVQSCSPSYFWVGGLCKQAEQNSKASDLNK